MISPWRPNGNIVATSEHPFGASDATTTIREYDVANAQLVQIFSARESTSFRRPRRLHFGPDDRLYCVARGEVIALDFASGQ